MKHHHCPVFYNRRWVSSSGKLTYYRVINGRVTKGEIAPRNTGYEEDLYAKEGVSEVDKHSIEIECYKDIDDKASKVLNKLINENIESLVHQEKIDWCRFMLSMMTRHSSIVALNKIRGVDIINRRALSIDPQMLPFVNEQLDYWRRNIGVETLAAVVTPNNKYGIKSIDRNLAALLSLHWWIDDYEHKKFKLLTCDYPVSLVRLALTVKSKNTISDMLESGEWMISFPISPTKCFYASHTLRPLDHIGLHKLVKMQNEYTLRSAKNFVYAYDNSQYDFIAKRLMFKQLKKAV